MCPIPRFAGFAECFRRRKCSVPNAFAFRFCSAALRRGAEPCGRSLQATSSMEPERLKFGYTAYGKPFLLNSPANIQFNVSHSGGLMVAAVCRDWPIGVDIEKHDPRFHAMEIAERFFCEHEKAEIARQDGEARLAGVLSALDGKRGDSEGHIAWARSRTFRSWKSVYAPLRVVALEDAAKVHGARLATSSLSGPVRTISGTAGASAGQPAIPRIRSALVDYPGEALNPMSNGTLSYEGRR